MFSPLAQPVRRVSTSIRTGFGAALIIGAALTQSATVAHAEQVLRCGPQFATVDAVRASGPDVAPTILNLDVDETDRYLAQLGFGRPENSGGKSSVIIVGPNGRAMLGLTDGQNMCSPYLRVTQRTHEQAIGAIRGIDI